jgi:acyl-CoA synthetase (AMP-forming)/AMP-acid ligase II
MMRFERILSEFGEKYRDRTAVITPGRSVTFGELEQLALGCAARLKASGAKPGEVTLVLAPNSLAFLVAYFGALMSGGIVAPLNPSAPTRELEAIIKITRPAAAVMATQADGRDLAGELGHLLPEGTIWIDDLDLPDWPHETDRRVIVDRDPASNGFLAFTSGSTGVPKGARHRTDTLVGTSAYFLRNILEGQAVTSASTFPMYNMGGLCMILPVVMGGGTIVILDSFSGPKLVDAIERHGVNFAVLTPAMAELLFLRGDLARHDVSNFDRALLCAAPISNRLCRRLASELGAKVFIAYGLTEIPGALVSTRPDTPLEEIGPFVGYPQPGYTLAILDDGNQPVPQGGTGEICVKTVYMLSEYIGNEEATASAVDADGWMHTGDLGMLRPDGGVVIQGRKKEMYIRGGFNVYPREVEEVLAEHPRVDLAAVHAVPDPVLGEKGFAWIVPVPGQRVDVRELRTFAAERLARYKVPDTFQVTDEIPLTSVGKVNKPALQQRAAEVLGPAS